MERRCLGASCILVALITVVLFSGTPDAQSTDWTVPRMANGRPDLQGIWTNATLTPVERPDSLAGRAILTAEEAAEVETTSAERRTASDRFALGDVGAITSSGWTAA